MSQTVEPGWVLYGVRIEFHSPAPQRPLVGAVMREDLLGLLLPSPGDTFAPTGLTSTEVAPYLPTCPLVSHVEHYPITTNGRALGSEATTIPSAVVVVRVERSGFTEAMRTAFEAAGWTARTPLHTPQPGQPRI